MDSNREYIEVARASSLANYRPAPFVLTQGEGVHVWDRDGQKYLDLSGGIAVLSVGHCHPKLVEAIASQAGRLMHVSNLFYNDRAIELAEQLTRRTGFAKVYFANSGTEAVEALLKLARRFQHESGHPNKTELVAAKRSFHGRTFGSLSVTGQDKYHVGMKPLLPGVSFVDYNDLHAMRSAISDNTAGVVLEPLQAEGGIIVPDDGYLKGVRDLCDAHGALLLFDEVQTGYGRTGRFLAREWSGVRPDACSLAKGIGGGFPLGAMAVTERVENGLPPSSHASTFGGNALACAAGLAVLSIFDEEQLVKRAERLGGVLREMLTSLVDLPAVVGIRGMGLLIGVALDPSVDALKTLAAIRAEHVLMTIAGGNVLRICPALTVTESELEEGVTVMRRVLTDPPKAG